MVGPTRLGARAECFWWKPLLAGLLSPSLDCFRSLPAGFRALDASWLPHERSPRRVGDDRLAVAQGGHSMSRVRGYDPNGSRPHALCRLPNRDLEFTLEHLPHFFLRVRVFVNLRP